MNEENSPEWAVFQQDVLDVLRQYDGFFDYFERVGSLSDDSRPDCFARVSREDKKEIWVVDAKNKGSISDGDRERMEKYLDMLRSNPIDIGLELTELGDYSFRGIFVTSRDASPGEHEQVAFSALHQFLQRELVYTDTDRVVRDVAKMVERKQLSQSQARLLFRGIKPFEERVKMGSDRLEELATEFIGLDLERPPIESRDYGVPVDAVLTHEERGKTFLFDIPYSEEELDRIEEKVGRIGERLSEKEEDVYYAAINTFDDESTGRVFPPSQLKREIMETAGIVSPDDIVDAFTPKIPVEKSYGDQRVVVRDTSGTGFRAAVETTDDVNLSVTVKLPGNVAENFRDQLLNTQRDFGEFRGDSFTQELQVTEDLGIVYSGRKEPLDSYLSAVKSLYRSTVSPGLAKKVSQAV